VRVSRLTRLAEASGAQWTCGHSSSLGRSR
jgi:hypothetical protein